MPLRSDSPTTQLGPQLLELQHDTHCSSVSRCRRLASFSSPHLLEPRLLQLLPDSFELCLCCLQSLLQRTIKHGCWHGGTRVHEKVGSTKWSLSVQSLSRNKSSEMQTFCKLANPLTLTVQPLRPAVLVLQTLHPLLGHAIATQRLQAQACSLGWCG